MRLRGLSVTRLRALLAAIAVLAVLGAIAPSALAESSGSDGSVRSVRGGPGMRDLARPTRDRDAKQATFAAQTVLVRFKRGATAAARDGALTRRGGHVVG